MSMVTYPLNNIEYTAEDAELFHSTRTSGVYATDSFDYSVTGADNSIVIGTGIAWIKNRQFSGKVVAQKEPMSLDMGLPDPIYPRIDAVVIQFNSNKNATEIVVKNGAASSFPIAPEVVRTESLYELHLYHVRREAGSLSISAPNITDLRNNNAYCGLMSDSITQAVDSTLSKNGVAADAAAVGNALAGLSPAQIGAAPASLAELVKAFGINVSEIQNTPNNSFDTLTTAGIYKGLSGSTGGFPDQMNEWAFVLNLPYDAGMNYGVQFAWDMNGNTTTAQRYKRNGEWNPWECENPPMVLGVEYRTTERWQGKAVYTKLVFGGLIPADGQKTFAHNASATHIIRCIASTDDGTSLPYFYYPTSIDVMATKTEVQIFAQNRTAEGGNVYAQIWYTKD